MFRLTAARYHVCLVASRSASAWRYFSRNAIEVAIIQVYSPLPETIDFFLGTVLSDGSSNMHRALALFCTSSKE